MKFKDYLRAGNGASDITPLLANKEAFRALVEALAVKASDLVIDKVVCVEGRGFLIGSPVAFKLNAGLVPVRSPGKLKNETFTETYTDYSGHGKSLQLHIDAVQQDERVLIVDDWVETGATMKATIRLLEKCGAKIIGIIAFMDDTNEELKQELRSYNYRYIETVARDDTF